MKRWHELVPGERIIVDGDACEILDVFQVPEADWSVEDLHAVAVLAEAPLTSMVASLFRSLRPLMIVARCQHGCEYHWRLNVPFQVDSTQGPVLLNAHHAVCSSCGDLWPCTTHRIDLQVACFAGYLASIPSAPEPQPKGDS